jgi:hypothetical protein
METEWLISLVKFTMYIAAEIVVRDTTMNESHTTIEKIDTTTITINTMTEIIDLARVVLAKTFDYFEINK